jgi:DNA-binding transcriptional LysR family regulator
VELRHLRYFVAVADELNFTRAAQKLHLSQPSLTRQIKNLEEELAVRLFDRARNRVVLTAEGVNFLVDARRLVALSVESVKAVQRFSRGESDQLNLGYLFRFNFDLLPGALMKFYESHADIAVNLFDMSPAAQLRALEERKIDLGFVGLRPTVGVGSDSPLVWECVARHDVVVVLPAHHPLVHRRRIAITDLRTTFFVSMSEETHPGSREWLTELCREGGFAPRVLQDVDLETGIMSFVAEGLGVTLAREQLKHLPHPGVVFRPLATPRQAEYWMAWHRENHSKSLQRFIEIVREGASPRRPARAAASAGL